MSNGSKWRGVIERSPGRLTFTGRLGSADFHAHAAVQVVQVQRGFVDLHVDGKAARVEGAVMISTNIPHALVAGPEAWGSVTYVDSELVGGSLPRLDFDAAEVESWFPQLVASDSLHPTLERAIERSRELVSESLLLKDLAAEVGISSSRLGHLFAEQLGLSYPKWRRWTRLEQALIEVISGASLTEAAHAAGFADSAHLTRTCRQMFGISPSEALVAVQGVLEA